MMGKNGKVSENDRRLEEEARRSIQMAGNALEDARASMDQIENATLKKELENLIAERC